MICISNIGTKPLHSTKNAILAGHCISCNIECLLHYKDKNVMFLTFPIPYDIEHWKYKYLHTNYFQLEFFLRRLSSLLHGPDTASWMQLQLKSAINRIFFQFFKRKHTFSYREECAETGDIFRFEIRRTEPEIERK